MINVKVDENGFYLGAFAKVGRVQGGIDMPNLPEGNNPLCYYIKEVEKTITEQVPVKVYKRVEQSETEFNTYYALISTDEFGNEILTDITEEEYNALSDEEKETVKITQVPITVFVEITEDEYNALDSVDKVGILVSYKLDEEGNIVYEDVEKTIIVKEWAFSQEKYDELEAQKIADEQAKLEQEEYEQSISAEVQAVKIEELETENALLKDEVTVLTECILEMSEMLYA